MRKHAPTFSPAPAAPGGASVTATVKSLTASACEIDIAGTVYPAAVATHVLQLAPGQQVALFDGGEAGWLVIAAWPLAGQAQPLLHYETATGTLNVHAARLTLSALAAIDLQCGDARLRLTLDGKAQIEGMEILSAATGSNRIEGGSIDLN